MNLGFSGLRLPKRNNTTIAGGPDLTVPTIPAGQTFSYAENKSTGYTVGTVSASDNVGVTQFRFSATTTNTSADGFFTINSGGVITMTASGAAGTMNDFDDGTNSTVYGIQAGDAANNWSVAVNVTISVTDVDDTAPVVTPAQSFSYAENQDSGYTIGTVLATDAVGVVDFRFTATGTAISSDGYFGISSGGVLTLTATGASSTANDYDDGTNSFVYGVQAKDLAGNWSASVNVTLNVTDAADPMIIGMNSGGIAPYGNNQPFADMLSYMSVFRRYDDASDAVWQTQNQGNISGATSSMTFYATVVNGDTIKANTTFHVLNPNGNEIGFGTTTGGGATPNRLAFTTSTSFDLPWVAGEMLIMHIKGNSTGSINVLMNGHATSFASGDYMNSDFVAFHAALGTRVLRTMDWTNTNGNIDADWSDRVVTGKIGNQGPGQQAVPWEVCIQAANRLNCDLWINIPVRATSAYVTSLFALIAANLNPGLKVFDEYGNELWNTAAGFKMNTSWAETLHFTKFTLSVTGSTFTKTAHGYAENRILRTYVGRQARGLGYLEDATGVGGLWWMAARGLDLYVHVLSANTFELWDGMNGTGNRAGTPVGVTELIAVDMSEVGKTADLNGNYNTKSLSNWSIADAALTSARVNAVVGALAASNSVAVARLANTSVAARATYLSPAPYHDGYVWYAQLDRTSGQFLPRVWANCTSTFHYSAYAAGSTPTPAERMAGTGTGYVASSHQTIAYTWADQETYTSGVAATGFSNGTSYDHYIDWEDADGFVWSKKLTIAASATPLTTDFYDTYANQQIRDLWDMDSDIIDSGVFRQIQEHLDAIAACSNTAIKVFNYEGGSHQSARGPSEFWTWMEAYRESSTYGDTLQYYYNGMAALGVAGHCHYVDCSSNDTLYNHTPWRIANTYDDVTDERFLAIASYGGEVPITTLVDSADVAGTDFGAAPTYPAVVKTFADATWTYTIVDGNEANNYSITGNVLSIIAGNGLSFVTPSVQTVKILATNGTTHAFFDVTFTTGSAWYESTARWAWSTTTDTTPAQLTPETSYGTAINHGGTAATVVSDGWDMNNVANYSGGSMIGGGIAYTDSPLFAIVTRKHNETGSFEIMAKYGTAHYVSFMTMGTNLHMTWDTGSVNIQVDHAWSNTLAVHWVYLDNTNLKLYTGKNQAEDTVGGTTYASQGASTFTDFVLVGGSTQAVISGGEVVPAANLTAAKAIIAKIQAEHGIP